MTPSSSAAAEADAEQLAIAHGLTSLRVADDHAP
jgi:hypothetical protein